ncbi:MAG: hypothetical protein V4555_00905 [Acidobacteriota bacterium]
MSTCDISELVRQGEYNTRLEFLYRVVEDTQNTIRFIDTKAAFCVTLLSGMAAVVLQKVHAGRASAFSVLFMAFIAATAISLVVCLRVIFPVVKAPKGVAANSGKRVPKFYIHQHLSHHWMRHMVRDSAGEVLSEDHASYTAMMVHATDEDLLCAMCDEVLMISLIRQMKSDRLHTAMFSLLATVALFAAAMLL